MSYSFTKFIPELLREKRLFVSVYDAGKVFSISVSDRRLHIRSIDIGGKCRGIDIGAMGMIGALSNSFWHDGYGEVRSIPLGEELSPHEIRRTPFGLYFVSSAKSEISVLKESVERVWRPSFVSDGSRDSCHLSGFGFVDDELRLVSAFSQDSEPEGWRQGSRNEGVLFDVPNNHVIHRGLSMPHSPRFHESHVWFCNSGRGELRRGDDVVATLPGITRGLDFSGDYAFVGLSRVRPSNVFSSMRLADTKCGVAVVDVKSGERVGMLELHDCDEVFSILVR